ncbi:MAG: YHS domain-containing protein [Pseudomonadaceae bacterium]|jgi:YHS domain-containing protein|nr:YHS domain-containing protein [Pseudomonadaceae bacterium]
MNLKKTFFASTLALTVALGAGAALTATSSFAYDAASPAMVNVDAQHLILQGYDVVAYFTQKTPTPGDKRFAAEHDGATYYFASAENLKTFQANPGHFAPQYGGYCAYGVAIGKKFDVDPKAFKVVNDKLYLNLNPEVFSKWSEDITGNLVKSEANWPKIQNKAQNAL